MELIAQEPDPAVVDDFILISVKKKQGRVDDTQLCNGATRLKSL